MVILRNCNRKKECPKCGMVDINKNSDDETIQINQNGYCPYCGKLLFTTKNYHEDKYKKK